MLNPIMSIRNLHVSVLVLLCYHTLFFYLISMLTVLPFMRCLKSPSTTYHIFLDFTSMSYLCIRVLVLLCYPVPFTTHSMSFLSSRAQRLLPPAVPYLQCHHHSTLVLSLKCGSNFQFQLFFNLLSTAIRVINSSCSSCHLWIILCGKCVLAKTNLLKPHAYPTSTKLSLFSFHSGTLHLPATSSTFSSPTIVIII